MLEEATILNNLPEDKDHERHLVEVEAAKKKAIEVFHFNWCLVLLISIAIETK